MPPSDLQDRIEARGNRQQAEREQQQREIRERREVSERVAGLYEEADIARRTGDAETADRIDRILNEINLDRIKVEDAHAIGVHINNGEFDKADELVVRTPDPETSSGSSDNRERLGLSHHGDVN